MALKDQAVQWLLKVSGQGGSWWMPLMLLGVSTVHSLTAGAFVGVLGVLQVALYTIIVMSRKYTFIIGPICLTIGGVVAAWTYVQVMKSDGAEALLEKTGAKGSSWLESAQQWANEYGNLGIILLSLSPAPTAVVVVGGVLAKMDEYTLMTVFFMARFVKMMLSAVLLKYVTQHQTPEQYVREQFLGEPKRFPIKFKLREKEFSIGAEFEPAKDGLEIKSISEGSILHEWTSNSINKVEEGDIIMELNGNKLDPKKGFAENFKEHVKDLDSEITMTVSKPQKKKTN